jgi:EpsD family peptidyl-prolyl cis-trans isomerase
MRAAETLAILKRRHRGRGVNAAFPRGLIRHGLLLGVCAALLAGCGRNEQHAASGQVVARLGNDVVTQQELENEFRLDNVAPEKQKDPEVVRRVLGDLVLRKYVVQQAIAAKFDREPSVLLDMLRSREIVLETAYLNRKASAKSPGRADVDQFISNNPAKFADRKIFSVEQIGFPIGPDAQSVVEANKNAKSLDDLDQKLTAAGVLHARQMGWVSSADLNPDFVAAIARKNPDDVFFVRAGSSGIFFKVTGEESRPLTGEAAANYARQLIRADAVKAEAGLAAYAAGLEVKYEGDYARIMPRAGAPETGIKGP